MNRLTSRRRSLTAAVLLVLTAPACGGATDATATGTGGTVLVRAQAQLASARSGEIQLELTARAAEGEAVGFRVEGRYAIEDRHRYPLLDVTYTRRPSGTGEAQLRSKGDAVYAGPPGRLVPLPDAQAAALARRDAAGSAVVPGLDLVDWIGDPVETEEGATVVVTGQLRASAMLGDIAALAGPLGGGAPPGTDRSALDDLVEVSEVRAVLDRDSGGLRSLDVRVDFSAGAEPELQQALGPYAALHLELALRYEPLREPLTVDVP